LQAELLFWFLKSSQLDIAISHLPWSGLDLVDTVVRPRVHRLSGPIGTVAHSAAL
jgi:hypothetical protein